MTSSYPSGSNPRPDGRPVRRLSVEACPGGWAIKHGDGFLGMSIDRDEALRLLRTLQDAVDEGWRSGRVTVSSQPA
jgi:hypothetical protein